MRIENQLSFNPQSEIRIPQFFMSLHFRLPACKVRLPTKFAGTISGINSRLHNRCACSLSQPQAERASISKSNTPPII